MTLQAKRALTPQQQLKEITKNTETGQRLIRMRRESSLQLVKLGIPQPVQLDDESIKREIIREIQCGIRGTILIL